MIDPQLFKNLYSRLVKIRMTEEAIVSEYSRQEIRCPAHLSIGQEAVAVGVCANLNDDDVIFSTHRCHSHYLAKEALEAAKVLEGEGIDIEVVDPRSTSPLDMDTILRSVRKTRRVIIADTGWENYGVTAEICSKIYEKAFNLLQVPVKRIALPNENTPCSSALEKNTTQE